MNIEEMLFFDIETVRKQKDLDINSEEFDLFQYKNRHKETGELLEADEVVKIYKKSAALYPAHNEIVCISVAFVKKGVCYYKAFTGTQKQIISEYYTLLNSMSTNTLCGFNIKQFDVPTTRLKALECGVEVKLNDVFSDSGKKPWELKMCDLMEALKGTGYNTLSVREACFILGIESPKDDISGAEVSEVYYSEGIDRIATYCNKDVITNVRMFVKIFAPTYNITSFVDKTEKLMDTVIRTKTITCIQEEAIVEQARQLTKKERENCVALLKVALGDMPEFYAKIMKVKK